MGRKEGGGKGSGGRLEKKLIDKEIKGNPKRRNFIKRYGRGGGGAKA
jgi:hypothetical protein